MWWSKSLWVTWQFIINYNNGKSQFEFIALAWYIKRRNICVYWPSVCTCHIFVCCLFWYLPSTSKVTQHSILSSICLRTMQVMVFDDTHNEISCVLLFCHPNKKLSNNSFIYTAVCASSNMTHTDRKYKLTQHKMSADINFCERSFALWSTHTQRKCWAYFYSMINSNIWINIEHTYIWWSTQTYE